MLVVGLIGLYDWTTHYSVNLKIESVPHHTILREGVPAFDEMEERQPHYYRFTVNNPNVTRVSLLLQTVHGDPDMFVSRSVELPSPWQFDQRSIRCGIYPEQVEFRKDGNNASLEGDYYIQVYGFVQSTYSIVYYLEVPETVPKIKLTTGQRQKGALKN